jgi:uncharacterized protein YbjT (DUF2867 family)
VARCLIIGCGCRGRLLASELRRLGHVVRATTRDPARLPEIEATGAEALLGDPDRIATIARALDHVTVAYVLLGSATGPPEQVRALHETRLEMLLSKMLDTTIHGVVYEAAGSVDSGVLRAGGALVRSVCEGSRIPYRLLKADPSDHGAWVRAAAAAADSVLG